MPNLDSEDYEQMKEQSLKRYYRDEIGLPDWEERVKKSGIHVEYLMKQIRRQVELAGKSVLDVGSGWGDFLYHVSGYATSCVGIEPDMERIALSKLSLQRSNRNVDIIRAVGQYLPFRPGIFDSTSCMSVLEHAGNNVSILKEMVRVTKFGGVGYVSFPNYLFPLEPHYHLV